jgi:NAD(P)-dependent dehydrogenase (short-subunit alcohol dehydrogenase family)
VTGEHVALVTGGARGIGAAIGRRLVAEGWRVVLLDRDPAGAATAAAIGAGARFRQCDVASEAEIGAAIGEIGRTEGSLRAAVCNAGIMIRKPIAELTLDEWNAVLATNLTSAFLIARAAAPMLRASQGAIVTIASTRAHMSEADTESYSASKGGVVALTHALAVSLGTEVRVNCISPGWIETKGATLSAADHAQHPAGRVGRPEDVAALCAFLLGPESGFATGAEFSLDGGMTRKMIYQE